MADLPPRRLKIVLVGDSGVGKSSLLGQFMVRAAPVFWNSESCLSSRPRARRLTQGDIQLFTRPTTICDFVRLPPAMGRCLPRTRVLGDLVFSGLDFVPYSLSKPWRSMGNE